MAAKININQLTSLRYLLEEKHVSRAATRACVSQPAMSKALQNLRDITGDPLLIRDGNDMKISPYAESILVKLTPALESLEKVLSLSNFDKKISLEKFTIASSDFFCSYILPNIFLVLNMQAPKISFRIIDWGLNNYKDLESGSIDIVAAAFLEKPEFSLNIEAEIFGEDHLVCLMASSHHLANQEMTMDDYLGQKHISVSGSENKNSMVEEHLSKFNHKRQVKISVPYYAAALNIIQNTDCLLTLPLHLAKKMSRDYSVSFQSLPYNSPKVFYYLLWPKLKEADEAHCWLRTKLLGIMSNDFDNTHLAN